jgi:pilus assembly protein Flp/PilA
LVEYALILVLVALVVLAVLLIIGPQIANVFSKVTNGLAST